MLRIHLFGDLRLVDDERSLVFAALPRTLSLWATLLLQRGRAVPRDRLAFRLWPDAGESEARANLRRHLHDLRRALPPAVPEQPWFVADGDGVRWNGQAAYWLDVTEFERLCGDGERLGDAVALYSGDLLPTLYDDWLLAERDRLTALYVATLQQLIDRHRARREYGAALAYARRLLHQEPLREDIVRDLMALSYAAGDRNAALREYHRFRQHLDAELAVAPLPETVALFEAISRNAPLPDPAAGMTAAAPAVADAKPGYE